MTVAQLIEHFQSLNDPTARIEIAGNCEWCGESVVEDLTTEHVLDDNGMVLISAPCNCGR